MLKWTQHAVDEIVRRVLAIVSEMSLITVVGRGHSGTRAISHTLYASGVFMGNTLNRSGDKVPPEEMYEACRVFARSVTWRGGLSWDFEGVLSGDVDPEFRRMAESYLADVLGDRSPYRGWKLPETTLAFPWIARMFPEARYIHLIRDPRDCILSGHVTDDLADFGVDYKHTDDVRKRRAISWKYQYELIRATPEPANWLTVRFEDFVLRQEETLARLEEFLHMKLARIIVREASVGRWREDTGRHMFECFREPMMEYGYAPATGQQAGG